MSELPKGWRRCRLCPPDDNAWPATGPFSAFTHAGTAYASVCNACFAEHYPMRVVLCSNCRCMMQTRGRGEPMCRRCRRGDPPVPCERCGNGPGGFFLTEKHGVVLCRACSRELDEERRAA